MVGGIPLQTEVPGAERRRAKMQGVEEGSALQKFASTVSLAQNTRRAVEMFKKKKAQPPELAGDASVPIVPIAPVQPPPWSTLGPSDVTVSVATDFKAGDRVMSRRMVEKIEVEHKVGDKVKGLWREPLKEGASPFAASDVSAYGQGWFDAVVAAVNSDGTCTLRWDDGDETQTVKKSTGEIQGLNQRVTKTRTFDKTLYNAMVKATLSDVFKEADANDDGKLTYDEWQSRMGKLMPADELKRLFDECDTDKNGVLDKHEFATGMAGKYEIQWAQVSI